MATLRADNYAVVTKPLKLHKLHFKQCTPMYWRLTFSLLI